MLHKYTDAQMNKSEYKLQLQSIHYLYSVTL